MGETTSYKRSGFGQISVGRSGRLFFLVKLGIFIKIDIFIIFCYNIISTLIVYIRLYLLVNQY